RWLAPLAAGRADSALSAIARGAGSRRQSFAPQSNALLHGSRAIAQDRNRLSCRRKPMKRQGFTLLLAIVAIGALGVTMGLLGAHFDTTLRAARSADLEIRAAQLLQSGVAWATLHRRELQALSDSGAVELPVSELCPAGYDARLNISRD